MFLRFVWTWPLILFVVVDFLAAHKKGRTRPDLFVCPCLPKEKKKSKPSFYGEMQLQKLFHLSWFTTDF